MQAKVQISVRANIMAQYCQEKFFMVDRSVGRRGVGRRRDESFYFFLEPPEMFIVFIKLISVSV